MSAASRAQSVVSCRVARWPARAVPHAPAPRTATFMLGSGSAALASMRRAVRRAFLRACELGDALLVQRLEVDFREVDRRETGARDRIGDVRAQVREQDGRACDADERIDLIGRNV